MLFGQRCKMRKAIRVYSYPSAVNPTHHLLREWAVRAIGVVLQTKILVDLQQRLLVRDCLNEIPAARIVAKQACRRGFAPSVAEPRPQFGIGRPTFVVFGSPERKTYVCQNFSGAGFAN